MANQPDTTTPAVSTRNTAAVSAATTGLRRTHLTPRSNPPTGRRRNRLTAAETRQVLCQGLGTGITPRRFLVQTFQADRFEIRGVLLCKRPGGTGSSDST